MNKTKIDWADMSWNPVTGCLHDCKYCYARKIAERFSGFAPEENNDWQLDTTDPIAELDGMQARRQKDGKIVPAPYPFGFWPTFHKYRLNEPSRIKKPQTIFVCSMADLFGKWVPPEWIYKVMDACDRAEQHRYLFLTKNPDRYEGYQQLVLTNKYFGATATTQDQMRRVRNAFVWLTKPMKRFVSIEPIQEPIRIESMFLFDWVIVGSETGNRKDKMPINKKWIDDIAEQCKAAKVPIFMKESIRSLMGDDFRQEFPWEAH